MSHPNSEAATSGENGGGLMEDVINIFVSPSSVFEHQRNKSFVMPALVQSVIFAVLVFALRNLIAPFFDAEFARQMAAQSAAAGGQAIPEGARAMSAKIATISAIAGPILAPWFTAIIGGLFTWVGARIVGAKLSYGQAATISAWSAFPSVLALITTAVMGMTMDASAIRGVADGQLGPGKFVDPATTSPALLALFQNLDVFTVWTVIILGIGIAVVARVPRGNGMVGAIIKWGIVVLFSVVPAVLRG